MAATRAGTKINGFMDPLKQKLWRSAKPTKRPWKKDEHAKATFPIWKYSGKKDEETGEVEKGRCFQKKSFWFTFDQVETVS